MTPIAIRDCNDSIVILGQVTVELECTRRSNIVLVLHQQYQKLSKNVPGDSQLLLGGSVTEKEK